MDASILIPTHARPKKLGACLAALARQTWPSSSFEVALGIDGDDGVTADAACRAWNDAGGHPQSLCIATFPKRGYIHVRHRLVPTLNGRIYISLNDDVVPEPDFVARHLAAHGEVQRHEQSVVIVGHSPFVEYPNPSLLNVLVAETSMVFFFDVMDDTHPDHDWGYRHCFGLNFSAPLQAVVDAGGVRDVRDTYGYDDIELAYRLGLPVLYRPDARAPHDHRYRPIDLLCREFSLGAAAVRYAQVNPGFARAVFHRDILDPREAAYALAYVDQERRTAERVERTFLNLADIPASTISGVARRTTLRVISQQFLLLKRYVWRQGLLAELVQRHEQYAPLTGSARSAA